MWESGYYPPGAEHDPNAPWNQSDPDYSEYEDEAEKRIDEEISDFSDTFEDWLSDNYEVEGEDMDYYDWYHRQDAARAKEIREAYIGFRLEDVCIGIASEKADYEDGLREAAREAYWESQRER